MWQRICQITCLVSALALATGAREALAGSGDDLTEEGCNGVIMIAVDTSQSARSGQWMNAGLRSALHDLLARLPAGTRVGLSTFGVTARARVPVAPLTTAHRTQLDEAIAALRFDAPWTDVYAGLKAAADAVAPHFERGHVLMLTDGIVSLPGGRAVEVASRAAVLEELAPAIRDQGTHVLTIALLRSDARFLETMTIALAGALRPATTLEHLGPIMRDFEASLCPAPTATTTRTRAWTPGFLRHGHATPPPRPSVWRFEDPWSWGRGSQGTGFPVWASLLVIFGAGAGGAAWTRWLGRRGRSIRGPVSGANARDEGGARAEVTAWPLTPTAAVAVTTEARVGEVDEAPHGPRRAARQVVEVAVVEPCSVHPQRTAMWWCHRCECGYCETCPKGSVDPLTCVPCMRQLAALAPSGDSDTPFDREPEPRCQVFLVVRSRRGEALYTREMARVGHVSTVYGRDNALVTMVDAPAQGGALCLELDADDQPYLVVKDVPPGGFRNHPIGTVLNIGERITASRYFTWAGDRDERVVEVVFKAGHADWL